MLASVIASREDSIALSPRERGHLACFCNSFTRIYGNVITVKTLSGLALSEPVIRLCFHLKFDQDGGIVTVTSNIRAKTKMAHTYSNFSAEARDPMTAACLSIIPGLGQYYNGQTRKGFLFLDVAIVNFLLLSTILLAPNIATGLALLGHTFNMEVNKTLIEMIQQLRLGSPTSMVVLGMVTTFVAYAVRDAYDNAILKRRKALYKDSVIELTEAASGSYILHASTVVAFAIMAIFFFIPQPTPRQVVEIEFINSLIKPTTPPIEKTKDRSTVSTNRQSKEFRKDIPINKTPPKADLSKTQQQNTKTANAASASSSQQSASSAAAARAAAATAAARASHSMPQVKPIAQSEKIAMTPPAPPMVQPIPARVPVPHPITPNLAAAAASFLPSAPALQQQKLASPALTPLPQTNSPSTFVPVPITSKATGQASSTLPDLSKLAAGSLGTPSSNKSPMPTGRASSTNANNLSLPGLSNVKSGGGNSNNASPMSFPSSHGGSNLAVAPGVIDGRPGRDGTGSSNATGPSPIAREAGQGRNSGNDAGDAPTPVRAKGTGRGQGVSVTPSVGRPAESGGSPQSGAGDRPLNQPGTGRETTAPTLADPDFTKYMADLQRRIKRAWFPPRAGASKKVKVLFKIHTHGELSNLRIVGSSGDAITNTAALQAVQNSAPFHPLPDGSPENVDIEFTFDYNVFSGRSI